MNVAKINYCDIANGIGCRVSVFVSGCRRHCKGCHNDSIWDFDVGEPFTTHIQNQIMDSVDRDWIDGISILGGEPFEPEHKDTLLKFLSTFKKWHPDKTVWIYSGNYYDEIQDSPLLEYCDVLVDGPYVEGLRNPNLQFRGSRNQRVINLNETRKKGHIVLRLDDKRGM